MGHMGPGSLASGSSRWACTLRTQKDVTWHTFGTGPTACHYWMEEPMGEGSRVMGLGGLLTFRLLSSSPPSFLQPPKPLSSLSTLRDGNWRDGCYWCRLMDPWRMRKKWKWGLCYLAGWVTVDAGIFFPFHTLTYVLRCFSVDQSQRLTIALTLCPRYRSILKPTVAVSWHLDLGSFCRTALYLNTFWETWEVSIMLCHMRFLKYLVHFTYMFWTSFRYTFCILIRCIFTTRFYNMVWILIFYSLQEFYFLCLFLFMPM